MPARRRRATGAGPCGTCRRSASRQGSGPRAGSGRPPRRRAVRRACRAAPRWPDGAPAGAPLRRRRSRRRAARRRARGRRWSPGRSAALGKDGCRARDLTKPACGRRLSGPPHRTIAAVRTRRTVQLSGRAGRPCCDPDRPRAYVECPCPVTRSCHATPWPLVAAPGSWPRSRSSSPPLGPSPARQPRSANRRWRRASCSAVMPGSGRGSRSPSISRTTARRSAASCGSRAARRARRASGWRSSCRPNPTRSTSCMASHRRSAPPSRSAWSTATRRSQRPSRRSPPTTRHSSSWPSSPSIPSGSSATSISCPTRTRSHRRS